MNFNMFDEEKSIIIIKENEDDNAKGINYY